MPKPDRLFPSDPAQRQRLRDAQRGRLMERAWHDSMTLAHSLKCAAGHHSDEPGGCANDGADCLCVCHDGTDGGESDE